MSFKVGDIITHKNDELYFIWALIVEISNEKYNLMVISDEKSIYITIDKIDNYILVTDILRDCFSV